MLIQTQFVRYVSPQSIDNVNPLGKGRFQVKIFVDTRGVFFGPTRVRFGGIVKLNDKKKVDFSELRLLD